MIRYLTLIYILSAVLSIVAFAGLRIDNMSLNSMTLYSGLVLIPVGIMTTVWGIKENNVQLNVNDISKGIYFIRIRTKNGIYAQKVIIN